MYPILFSFGQFSLYSFSAFLVLSWCVYSFFFWRFLRSAGVDEDKIFDLTFYVSISAFVLSRVAFIFFHWELFSDTWLKMITIWVQPGLSLYGAIIGSLLTVVAICRSQKVRLGLVLDAYAVSFAPAMITGLIGAFLDGTIVGKIADFPWTLRVIGQVGRRHPLAIYEIIFLFFVIVFMSWYMRMSIKKKYPHGSIGVWFFLTYSIGMFILEFFNESQVYWLHLSANQWILIALFAESMGAFYVRGGGREKLRPLLNRFVQRARLLGFKKKIQEQS